MVKQKEKIKERHVAVFLLCRRGRVAFALE
jgi:hypothetical protein